ncbi:MAG: hypothetical protein ABI290_03105 [Ginsengibacter sp.]
MKNLLLIFLLVTCFVMFNFSVEAQCSICSKTVQQMGNKAAEGFNSGIIYLMLIPYAAIGFVGYKWWKSDHEKE